MKINKKHLIITAVILLIAVAGFFIYKYKMADKKLVDDTAKTTSDSPSAQSNFKSDDTREPTTSSQKPEISVSDTGGSTQVQSSAAPLTSKDGAITVSSPTSGALFNSGSSLVGRANVSKVSYRLIDNVSGVTATGDLSVNGGNFSGKFSFSTKATEGRLDVFQTGAGGIEKSIIEIPVKFR